MKVFISIDLEGITGICTEEQTNPTGLDYPSACTAMRADLDAAVERKMEKYRPLFIGGEWVEPASGKTMDDVDPATGEVTAKIAVGGREDIDRAVAAAQKAYDEVWFDTPAKERSAMLLKLADAIDEHGDEFARLESIDVGKPISVAAADIPVISDNLRFFAGAARCPEGKSSQEYERGFTSIIRREPLGVTAGICPWNYPLMMVAWKVGPALAAGNTSIIKPASLTPLTSLYFAELAAISPKLDEGLRALAGADASLAAKASEGGSAPGRVWEQLAQARALLAEAASAVDSART